MKLPSLFGYWICVTIGFLKVQGLVFDILRNSSALTPHDVCAVLRCQARGADRDAHDIHKIISLVISEKDPKQKTGKPLAELSFFNTEVHIPGDPARVSAIGQLLAKEGELSVYLKDPLTNCLSGIFICELRYINSKGKGEIVKAEKQSYTTGKQPETSQHVSDTLKSLKTLIADEVSKLGEQTANVTANVVSIVTSMNERLFRIESMIEGDLQTRLSSLDLKLNKLEVLLSENVEVKLRSLTEAVGNSTDVVKGYVNDGLLKTQHQMNILEASITNGIASTESRMNESFQGSSASHMGCEKLQANISSMFHLVQDNISTFKTDVLGRFSAASNGVESSSNLLSTRLIMESLVRIAHNVSTVDSKIVKLKSNLDTDMKSVRLNISSLTDKMANRHDRFTREVKGNISHLENILNAKFKELENQKQSLASLDQDMKGKLFNIEINLKDINVVIRSIKYIFGL